MITISRDTTITPSKPSVYWQRLGIRMGSGFPVVQLWTLFKAESTKDELAAYQEYLADLGVQVEVHVESDWPRYREMLTEGKLPMFRLSWSATIPDPDDFLSRLLHSRSQNNRMFYRHARVDQLLDQAETELDEGQRIELYREVERIVMDDAPWITQHYHVFERLFQPYVQGVEVSLLGDWAIPLKKIWFKKSDVAGSMGITPMSSGVSKLSPTVVLIAAARKRRKTRASALHRNESGRP